MEETATTASTPRVPRYDQCERPGGWLLTTLLLACIQPFFFGIFYLPSIICGLLAGCTMFLHLLHSVGKPSKARSVLSYLFWLMIWISIQPPKMDFMSRLMVGLQQLALWALTCLMLRYFLRETVAKKSTGEEKAEARA